MAPMKVTGRPVVALPSELATSTGGVAVSGLVACSVSFSRTILSFYVSCVVCFGNWRVYFLLSCVLLGVANFVMLKLGRGLRGDGGKGPDEYKQAISPPKESAA